MKLKIGSFHLDFWQEKKQKKAPVGRPRIKLDVDQIRQMRAAGMSLREIGRKFHVSKDTVANVLKR